MSLPDQPRRRDAIDLVAALVFVAGLGAAGYIWRYGPAGPLPMHFDIHGRVDGWGDRSAVAFMTAILTVVLAVSYALMGVVSVGRSPEAGRARGLRSARLVLVATEVMIAVLGLTLTFGSVASLEKGGRLMPAILALIFLVVGAMIGKAGPNPFVGVRTYWTFRSRLAWDKSNRLAGRLFFWIGLFGLAASLFVEPAITTPALIFAILVASAASVFESWRVWRTDPERNP